MERESRHRDRGRGTYRRIVEALAIEEHCGDRVFSRVMDFGCGTGWFVSFFSRRQSHVIGMEVRPEALSEAREVCLSSNALLVRYRGDIIPLRPATMDLILSVGVIRSLMDRGPLEPSLGELFRCLRPGGLFLLIETENRAFRRYMKAEDLRRSVMSSGFNPVAWYPIRKVSWCGLRLIKMGLIPKEAYHHLAKWELWSRRRLPFTLGKHAYLGAFAKAPT